MVDFYILLSHCFPGASEHYLTVRGFLAMYFLVFLRLLLYRSFLHSFFLSFFLPETHYFLMFQSIMMASTMSVSDKDGSSTYVTVMLHLFQISLFLFFKRVSEYVALTTVCNGGSSVLGLLTVTRQVSLCIHVKELAKSLESPHKAHVATTQQIAEAISLDQQGRKR